MDEAGLKLERLKREEEAGVPPSPTDYQFALAFDSNGFTITDIRSRRCEAVVTRWADICRATAFKRDLFAIDCICVRFGLLDGTEIEVDEDMAGWKRFLEVLPHQLSGCKPQSEWFSTVALPPFAANPIQIYVHAAV
jgi:hypothetical protein